jgi:nondiscriminating glutamyl-tRNA synthetase
MTESIINSSTTSENPVVRTRFAPSPTGALHIGGVRTALFAYLFAKHHGGKFLLRIEDTDRARFVDGAIEQIIAILNRLGLHYDEGVVVGTNGAISHKGDLGPYLQSERLAIYHQYAEQLVASKNAYYCFCDEERLTALRKEQIALKLAPMYDKKCRRLSKAEVDEQLAAGKPHVIRQAIPENGSTTVTDLVFGEITWENNLIDDQVLMKSDGFPTYFLAVVVDDHLMQITHAIRGEEWLPSTPKHILLYEALNWKAPAFAHLPVVLNKDRTKLSKRQGDVSAQSFLDAGYIEEAVLNFLALLGWNPKTEQEIFTLEELIAQFDFSKVNKSGAVFDTEKLDWINGMYIRAMDTHELTKRLVPYLLKDGLVTEALSGQGFTAKNGAAISAGYITNVALLERERLKKFLEIGERVSYFFDTPAYAPELLIWKKSTISETRKNLSALLSKMETLDDAIISDRVKLEETIKAFITELGTDNGSVLWPMRIALSGMQFSPSPFEIAEVLHSAYGTGEICKRLVQEINYLA